MRGYQSFIHTTLALLSAMSFDTVPSRKKSATSGKMVRTAYNQRSENSVFPDVPASLAIVLRHCCIEATSRRILWWRRRSTWGWIRRATTIGLNITNASIKDSRPKVLVAKGSRFTNAFVKQNVAIGSIHSPNLSSSCWTRVAQIGSIQCNVKGVNSS